MSSLWLNSGARVQAGCPVYVRGELHLRPLELPAGSSTDRDWRIDTSTRVIMSFLLSI